VPAVDHQRRRGRRVDRWRGGLYRKSDAFQAPVGIRLALDAAWNTVWPARAVVEKTCYEVLSDEGVSGERQAVGTDATARASPT